MFSWSAYIWSIVWGWFGIALLFLSLVNLARWVVRTFLPKKISKFESVLEFIPKWRWYVLLILFIVAQTSAYRELALKPTAPPKVEPKESPNVDLLAKLSEQTNKVTVLQDENEKLKAGPKNKDNEIGKLRSTTGPRMKQPSNPRVEQPSGLSAARCADLAEFIKKGYAALERLKEEDFSEQSRQNTSYLTNEIKTWLDTNLGSVQGQAFTTAAPWPQVFQGMSVTYGGIYQSLRGRLTYLTSLADRKCS